MYPNFRQRYLRRLPALLLPLALVGVGLAPRACAAYTALIGVVSTDAKDGMLMVRTISVDARAATITLNGKPAPMTSIRKGMRITVEGWAADDGRTLTAERIELEDAAK